MKPEFNYSLVASIVTAAKKSSLSISVIVLRWQVEQMKQTEESIYEHMRKNYQVMAEYIESDCSKDLKGTSGLTGGSAFRIRQISEGGKSLAGSFLPGALYRALAVSEFNAAIGRIMAAPIAGGCDILPAALPIMQGEKRIPERGCVMSLFTVSAVGMVIANNASLAGTQGGCQTECGFATAMAAIVIVELADSTPKMVKRVIAIAIKNILGLICDPVVGLVETPCIKRNASGVAGASAAAELASVGIESAIPVDEVTWTMEKVDDAMSSTLKEAAEGGLAATPTERRLHGHVLGTVRGAHSGCSGCGGCSS